MSKEKLSHSNKGFLGAVERVCDQLPPPGVIFFVLFFVVAVFSLVLSIMGISAVNPATGESIVVKNFFSADGLLWLLSTLVDNFTGFAPLGMVIVTSIGIGICDEAGLFSTAIRCAMRRVSPIMVPFAVAFIGCCGNVASDCANIVLIPLAAAIYLSVGKHPVVGMICAYAGVEAGYASNVMLAGADTTLAGLTNSAIQVLLPNTAFEVDVSCNYFFTFASTFIVAATIAIVTEKIVGKHFGSYTAPEGIQIKTDEEITKLDRKGLRNAGIAGLVYMALIVAGYFYVPLARVLEDGSLTILKSPFLNGLIPIIFGLFSVLGVIYGYTTGVFKSLSDVNAAITNQMKMMGGYIVFCFFCGQFQALFTWTQIGTLISVGGADLLQSIGLRGIPLMVIFILVSGSINIFMPSASAKWAILGPVFVPMLMILGYHPAFIQLLYRIGDSPTNILTPLNPYLWVLFDFAKRDYDPNIKLGKIVSGIVPVSLILAAVWLLFFVIWTVLGLPIGPGITQALPGGVL